MKRVEVVVSKDEETKVEEVLRASEFLYSKVNTETSDSQTITFQFVIPDEVLDDLIANLSNRIDLRKKENIITVYDVKMSMSKFLEKLQQNKHKEPSQNPLEVIVQPLEKYERLNRDLLLMLMLATLIALFGLFLDNVTIVIGAMLISPILGPINSISVNACLGRGKRVLREEALLLMMLLLSILFAAACTFLASRVTPLALTDQILSRTHVTDIDVIVSLFLGVAGGMALVTALPEILVGVAVAAALIPPMAVVGLGIGLDNMTVVTGSLLLTLSNLFGLKAGSIAALLSKGVSPRKYYEKQKARRYGIYLLLIFSAILLILALLIGIGVR
ncbi:MAG: TIGR00341 family protein [Nitrososphaerota archaeon]|nr:TIGR00341 family protein [Nitrososphaerota archaeon]